MKQPAKKPFPIYQVLFTGSFFLFFFFMTTWQNGASWEDTVPLIVFALFAGVMYYSWKTHPDGSNIKVTGGSTYFNPIAIIFLALFSLPFFFPQLFDSCPALQHVIPEFLFGGLVMYFLYDFVINIISQLSEGKKHIGMLITAIVMGMLVYQVISRGPFFLYYLKQAWECLKWL